MGCPLKISLETDHSASEVLFQPISGQVWGVRTCSVLLESELAHERRVKGLKLTFEGFEDLHITFFGDCQCCARFFDEDWSNDASGRDCSPHRALRRVQGLGDWVWSGGPPENICLWVRLSVKMEVGFIWGPKEVKETLGLLDLVEYLDCHSLSLLLVWDCKGLQRLYSVWVRPDIVHQHSPASLAGHTEGLCWRDSLTLLISSAARFLGRSEWLGRFSLAALRFSTVHTSRSGPPSSEFCFWS